MERLGTAPPSLARSAAGKANRALRKGLTPAGRERLRQAALKNQPWRFATGPRTAAGKAQAAANGKSRQIGQISVRELRAELADLKSLVDAMAETRDLVMGQPVAGHGVYRVVANDGDRM